MAEAFSPEIGMDIGASNVRTTSGVSVDLSGVGSTIGKMFSKPEVKVTEAEIKRQRLQPLQETWSRIDSSDLPDSRKKILKSEASRQFIGANIDLSSEVTSALKSTEGVETPAEGVITAQEFVIKDFERDDNNKDIVGLLKIQSLNDDGTLNTEMYNNKIYQEIQKKYELSVLKKETEERLTGSKQAAKISFFGIPEQGIVGEADKWAEFAKNDAEQFFNKDIATKFVVNADKFIDSPEAAAEAVGILEKRRDVIKNDIISSIRKTSIDLSDKEVEAEINAIMSPYDLKIAFLKQPAADLKRLTEDFKSINEIIKTRQDISSAQGSDIANSVLEKATGIKGVGYIPSVQQALGNYLLTDGTVTQSITEYIIKNKQTPLQAIGNSPQALSGLSYTSVMRPSTVLTDDGTPQQTQPGEVTPETENRLSQMPVEDRKKTIDAAVATMATYPSLTPDQLEYALPSINDSLVLMQKSEQKMDNGQLKYMFRPEFFKMVEDVAVKRPDAVPSFAATADNAILDQLDRNISDMRRSLEAVEESAGSKIFKMVVSNGRLTIIIDPDAINKSQELRAIIAEVGSNDAMKVIESVESRGFSGALLGFRAANPTLVRTSLDNVNYLSANVLTLSPELQKVFPKSLGKIKNEMSEFNTIDYQKLSQRETLTKFKATEALTQQPEMLGRNINQDMSNNPDALTVGEVAGKIREQTATEEDLLRSDEAMKRLEAAGIRISPEQIPNLTKLYEASQSISSPTPSGPRRIRFNELLQNLQGGGANQ